MNYYEHHIGDYAEATLHLTFVEDAAYSRCIRKYYSTEKPLPADLKQVQRLVGARTKEEKSAVQAILEEFFSLEADGWHNKRCDSDLSKFLDGEPEREVKKANEDNRLRKHREERASLFKQLTDAGQHAPWNIGIAELRAMVERLPNGKAAMDFKPLPATAPATPATATQTPDTRHQTPDTSNQTPLQGQEQHQHQPLSDDLPVAAQKVAKPKTATGSRLPADWKPNKADIDYCRTERPELLPSKVAANFYDYWIAKPGAAGRKLDWSATWRMWVRKESAATAGRAAPGPNNDLTDVRRQNTEEAMRLLGIPNPENGVTIDAE